MDESRLERMPPSAPPSCKNAGSRILKASSVVNCSLRSSSATPTRIVTAPVSASIGRLSASMRLKFWPPSLNPRIATATAETVRTRARLPEKTGMSMR